MPPLSERAAARARRDPGSPLLTHYHPAAGERVELNARSLANWLDKTANLLDALGVDADSEVALPVLLERPAGWMGLLLPPACWQRGVGCRVTGRDEASSADVAVIGPADLAAVAPDTLACSMHPWGLGLPALPEGVTDFSSAALAEPDVHTGQPADPDAIAWADAEREVTFAELAALPGSGERVLLHTDDPWTAVSGLWTALSGDGSLVLVEGDADEATLARLADAERAAR
ncbi:TIGR03089 family protein [Nigerium massiliense]|uniref:TIGR03089 family protein n=1 Tax=Nigerium massiliense TaxID=1522317 RepID=UPI00058B1B20|nr:TIGR03089 family protein [Nigerium massiliense]